MNELLKSRFFRQQVHSVVSDRDCPAIEKAASHGVRTAVFKESDKSRFSDRLLDYLVESKADYVISFYTKLFMGELLDRFDNRIINLHPSLLPAFKGLDGYGDAVKYGVRFVGSTIHFIDGQMDEGKIIAQTICPLDPDNLQMVRHRIFEQQCRSLLQVIRWLVEERIEVTQNRVAIKGAVFNNAEFSPALDFNEAIELRVPCPF